MNLLFNRKPKDSDTVSIQETPKKKVRGKPFAHGDDPRRHITGRPKLGNTLAARYRDALSEAESEAKDGEYTKLDAMIDILIGKAMEGDQRAIEYLQERGWGKVPDRLELSREGMDQETVQEKARKISENLTMDERRYMLSLHQKANGEQPEELQEFDGTKQVRFRYVLTKQYIDNPALPDVVEGTVSE